MSNIALPTVFLLLCLLPGYIVINSYNRSEGANLNYSPFTETSARAIIYAALFQFIWVLACSLLDGKIGLRGINFPFIAQFLTGQARIDDPETAAFIQPGRIFFYFISQYLMAFALGHGGRFLVISQNLDWVQESRYPRIQQFMAFLFSYHMPWFNLLKGRNQTAHDTRGVEQEIAGLLGYLKQILPDKWQDTLRYGIAPKLNLEAIIDDLITVLDDADAAKKRKTIYGYVKTTCAGVIETDGEDYIIKGGIDNFYYDSKGALDRILLRNAEKRKYASPVQFTPIEGDLLVVKYSSLKSLNIAYENLLLTHARAVAKYCAEDLKLAQAEDSE